MLFGCYEKRLMTIQFNCPACGVLIAFDNKHCGKHAHCDSCGQAFIIPSKNYEDVQQTSPEQTEIPSPEPGFYQDVFLHSWKIFINPRSLTGLVFVVAAVCFKFFLGHVDYSFATQTFLAQFPIGTIVTLVAWGCLLWYYCEIIYFSAYDEQDLPESEMGGLFGFIGNVVKSIYMFFIALLIVQLPCIITIIVLAQIGIESSVIVYIFMLGGLFVFPMAILTLAIGRDFSMLLPHYLLLPIFKALGPYFLTACLLILAWQLQLWTKSYGQLQNPSNLTTALHLLANFAVQTLAIIAMRSIGIFYKHYYCYFHW